MSTPFTPQEQQIRAFIYHFFIDQERPPTVEETAVTLNLSPQTTVAAYQQLNDKHAIFLEPGQTHVRMANPFSAVATPFHVYTANHHYYANCAWDAFAIAFLLQRESRIEASCADCGDSLTFTINDGHIDGPNTLIHFAHPFSHWYDDLIDT